MNDLERSEEIRSKIQDWLLQDRYSLEEKPEGKDLAWLFVARCKDISFGISQRIDRVDEVYIRLSVEFGVSLANLTLEEQKNFQKQLRFHLLHLDVEFDFDGLERLIISQRIFEDALTKDNFLSRMFRVQRAAIVTGWLLAETLEQVKEPFKIFRPTGNGSLN